MTTPTRTGNACVTFICLCAITVLLFGCSLRHSPQSAVIDRPGLGSALVHIGQWCIYAGATLFIAATLVRVLGFFPNPITAAIIAVASPFIGEAIAIGIAATVLGGVVVWFGVHSWVLYSVGLVFLALYAYKHRKGILKWLNFSPRISK